MTPKTFEKRRHTNKIVGVAIGAIGLLPAWMSLNTFVSLRHYMDRDPSLGQFIAVTGFIALAFFAFGLWIALKPQRVGLDLALGADGLRFRQGLFLRKTREGLIQWDDVERIVYEDAPRVGASLQFFSKDGAAAWHKIRLALKITKGNFRDILAAMEESASATGHRFVLKTNLPLLIYDRRVYRLENMG